MNMPTKNSDTDQTKNKKRFVFAQKTGADYTAIKLLEEKSATDLKTEGFPLELKDTEPRKKGIEVKY